MSVSKINWWVDRLRAHHGTRLAAFDAQLKHLGAEYGELLQEYQIHTGANPRKLPEDRDIEIIKELCDVIITANIMLELWKPSSSPAAHVHQRLNDVTRRMMEFDMDQTTFTELKGKLSE